MRDHLWGGLEGGAGGWDLLQEIWDWFRSYQKVVIGRVLLKIFFETKFPREPLAVFLPDPP